MVFAEYLTNMSSILRNTASEHLPEVELPDGPEEAEPEQEEADDGPVPMEESQQTEKTKVKKEKKPRKPLTEKQKAALAKGREALKSRRANKKKENAPQSQVQTEEIEETPKEQKSEPVPMTITEESYRELMQQLNSTADHLQKLQARIDSRDVVQRSSNKRKHQTDPRENLRRVEAVSVDQNGEQHKVKEATKKKKGRPPKNGKADKQVTIEEPPRQQEEQEGETTTLDKILDKHRQEEERRAELAAVPTYKGIPMNYIGKGRRKGRMINGVWYI